MMERTRQLVGAEPSRTLRYLPLTVLAVDVVTVAVVGALALIGREQLHVFDPVHGLSESLGPAGPAMVVGWIALIAALGGYHREVFGSGTDEYKRVFHASLLAAGLVGVACYLAKYDMSRGFFLLAFLLGLPGLLLGRWLVRRLLHSARRHGFLQVRILVSGTPGHVDEVTRVLRRESWLGYRVIGAVTPEDDFADETPTGVPVLGLASDVTPIARDAQADLIFFANGSLQSAQDMREKVWDLEDHGINVVIAPSLDDISSERVRVRPVGGLPLIHVDPPRWSDAAAWGKRLFDIVGSLALIVAFTPLLIAAALRIRLHDGGPVLFRQARVGLRGETFSCLKFRTMIIDAEERLRELHAQTGYDPTSGLFKMAEDPRVTKPGRWLRRFSIDELPQLFNVLKGDMSLVGPRPPLPLEVAKYDRFTHRRLHVRPGMTGLWQVSGRSDLSWEEAIRLDLFYVDNWSMLQDLSILVRTVGAVFASRGAY